mmetsp:Transcript_38668/g.78871  ORF Transcript_38668/g.78871 Transcript_38668/m.78871 type:complete len:161 (-) Transcript_38668:253-735(-)|eukprot:CAMPEP_0183298954 /NCGR_PEP_ID=MMETSP0160_2-20130417/5816_1 /TAXON_ID=2839 ORGANISM="Odontella Sinensis, Strain Grunow 1884" /NCGR_SAMPLE_ID=MMETSP0160_2 /ASSEMBLY_ACC=CAM_ASM_000250 /LENGTH=160 /DNA_ID=CAMNT_0025461089 /DNA_START=102 /DNA_END=584 /DNA_ORIENTATION=-
MTAERDMMSLHNDALEDARNRHGDDHPKVAEALTTIGLFHHHVSKEYEKALLFFNEALMVLRKSHKEEEHAINAAITMTDIGCVHQARGDKTSALLFFNAAISIFSYSGTSEYHPSYQTARRAVALLDPYLQESPTVKFAISNVKPHRDGLSTFCRSIYR